jgi:hypothetical protein
VNGQRRHDKGVAGAAVGGLAVLALWLVEPASALLSAESVRTTRAYETTPAAAEDYVAWAQAPLAARGRYVAFVKKGAAAKVRVNPVGVAFVGGLDLASRRLVYQQIYRGQSNLKFFHLDTREITNPPTGVNTGQWECCASISGDRLLFNRESLSTPTRRVMLRELAGETQLAVIRRDKYFVSADQLNGDFAVWTKCTERCNVFRRDLALMTTRVLPKPETKPPRDQFGSSVASDGTVYLVRSGPGCGNGVRIVRFRTGDGPYGRIVARLREGRDMLSTYAAEQPGGSVEVFYDRIICRTKQTDIFKITDP